MDKLVASGRIVRFSLMLANFGLLGSLTSLVGGHQALVAKVDLAVLTVLGWIIIVGLGLALQKMLEAAWDRPPRALTSRQTGSAAAVSASSARTMRHW